MYKHSCLTIHLIAKVLHMSRTLVALEVISFCPRESWNEMLQIYNSVWMDAVDKLNFKGDTVQCFCRYMYKSLGKWTRTRNECYMFRYRYKYAEYRTILEAVWCLFLSILFAYQIWKKNIIQELTLTGHWCQNAIGCSWIWRLPRVRGFFFNHTCMFLLDSHI